MNDKAGVASAFNAFFTSVGAKLASKFQNITPVILTRCDEQFKFHQVGVEKVHKLMANLQIGKAQGTDSIPAKIEDGSE